MNDNQALLQASKEISELCRTPAKCAYDGAVRIGRILLNLQNYLTMDEVISWCLKNTILTETAVRNYISLTESKIDSPFITMIEELGMAYKLLMSKEERETIEKIEEGTRIYLRKRRKIASEALTELIKKDSGKFASKERFMERWVSISDPEKDSHQEMLFIILEDYLAHIDDSNRRLEAIHTIITKLRRRANDLQRIISAKQ